MSLRSFPTAHPTLSPLQNLGQAGNVAFCVPALDGTVSMLPRLPESSPGDADALSLDVTEDAKAAREAQAAAAAKAAEDSSGSEDDEAGAAGGGQADAAGAALDGGDDGANAAAAGSAAHGDSEAATAGLISGAPPPASGADATPAADVDDPPGPAVLDLSHACWRAVTALLSVASWDHERCPDWWLALTAGAMERKYWLANSTSFHAAVKKQEVEKKVAFADAKANAQGAKARNKAKCDQLIRELADLTAKSKAAAAEAKRDATRVGAARKAANNVVKKKAELRVAKDAYHKERRRVPAPDDEMYSAEEDEEGEKKGGKAAAGGAAAGAAAPAPAAEAVAVDPASIEVVPDGWKEPPVPQQPHKFREPSLDDIRALRHVSPLLVISDEHSHPRALPSLLSPIVRR